LQVGLVGYRFPEDDRDPWDSNWLLVSVRVLVPEGSWEVVDPCLTTWEAHRLASWLRAASDPDAAIAPMTFAEPNLTVTVRPSATSPLRVLLRACFALELRPPWIRTATGPGNLFVELDVGRPDLARASTSLLVDLMLFPQRGEDPTL